MFFEALPKVLFARKFFNYRQQSSVEFRLASLLSVPDWSGSGCLHDNFLVRFHGGPVLVPLAVLSLTVPSVFV